MIDIEEKAMQNFVNNISIKDIDDDEIRDYLNVRVDVDRYNKRLFECVIPAETILEWIQDDFNSIVDSYLRHEHVRKISDLANPDDKSSANNYYAFCLDTYQAALDYWFTSSYKDKAWEYFREYGEEV